MSLADRITKPEESQSNADTAGDSSSAPQITTAPPPSEAPLPSSSWADEAEDDPVEPSPATKVHEDEAKEEKSDLGKAQTDGATEMLGGEVGVIEPSYEVEIKLADMQANPNDPLYSIKTFEELGL